MQAQEQPLQSYGFRYTTKDLILYALAIGMGTDQDTSKDEERFVYEHHKQFSPLPTFWSTLSFWSNKPAGDQTTGRLPAFPPPIMTDQELIPAALLRKKVNWAKVPIIHGWQSMVWHQPVPIPSDHSSHVETSTTSKTILIEPKSVGTFVTTETLVYLHDASGKVNKACTMQSTTALLGLKKDTVSPFDSGVPKLTTRPTIPYDDPPILEWIYETSTNQALMYRMASGDTNHIHVDSSVAKTMGNERLVPLLHGFCTLAIAVRGLLRVVPDADRRLRQLEAKFTQPVFVGTKLMVKIWKGPENSQGLPTFLFVVEDDDTETVMVDCGYALLESTSSLQQANSKL